LPKKVGISGFFPAMFKGKFMPFYLVIEESMKRQ
jgi:hypothetical protein